MFDLKKLKNAQKDVKKMFSKDQLDEIMKKAYKLKEENPKISMIECVSVVLTRSDLFCKKD